jgi:integrase
MPIELRKGRNGKLRTHWYGRYEVNGKRHTVNLGVKVAGTPPASLSLREEGDTAFERSRAKAQAKLEHLAEDARSRRSAEHLVERIYEMRTGEKLQDVALNELSQAWESIPRKRKPNARYAAQCKSTLERFVAYLHEHYPEAQDISQVTRPMALAFLKAEENRGITAKTWNDVLKLLRATFKHLLNGGGTNPFGTIPTRDTETVFRKPFTPEELKAIQHAAQGDDFIRPVILTGMCTAMRRGDCCLLVWNDVDLDRGFITVKTNKTGQTVDIPLFGLLHGELAALPRSKSKYVFPEQAEMYRMNPDGITWRVRKVFAAAGFKDPDEEDENGEKEKVRGKIHADREGGLRRASVRDFHSFRVTWVTLALTAGVPLELVQKVTGHKTVDVVLKHYFQPGREDFKRTLQAMMPKLLTQGSAVREPVSAYGGQETPAALLAKAVAALENMNGRNWKKQREEALRHASQAAAWIEGRVLHEKKA